MPPRTRVVEALVAGADAAQSGGADVLQVDVDDAVAETVDQPGVVEAGGDGMAGVEQQAELRPGAVDDRGDLVEGLGHHHQVVVVGRDAGRTRPRAACRTRSAARRRRRPPRPASAGGATSARRAGRRAPSSPPRRRPSPCSPGRAAGRRGRRRRPSRRRRRARRVRPTTSRRRGRGRSARSSGPRTAASRGNLRPSSTPA